MAINTSKTLEAPATLRTLHEQVTAIDESTLTELQDAPYIGATITRLLIQVRDLKAATADGVNEADRTVSAI